LKIFFRLLKYLIFLILFLILIPYLICPFYKYPDLKPFSGDKFYNPYANIDSTKWRKANFHAHSRQWTGFTAGSSNHEEDVAEKYREIKYDIIGISDYQSINTFLANDPAYIPVYEHGYGILKSHQLVIGVKSVSWYEFMLFQSFHNSQDIILHLRNDDEVISVNHPKLRNAFPPDVLKYLKGYDLLEVSSHSYFNATDLWDTVLTAGNPVFALGSDDNHDINDPEDYGYVYTMINSPGIRQDEILNALRSGIAFAVELEPQKDSSPNKKLEQYDAVPVITLCRILNDTVSMTFNKAFDTLKLIGNNGFLRAKEINKNSIIYITNENDTYIRAELTLKNAANIFLNPVFRYNGKIDSVQPEIDYTKTWLFRCLYSVIIGFICLIFLKFNKKKSRFH